MRDEAVIQKRAELSNKKKLKLKLKEKLKTFDNELNQFKIELNEIKTTLLSHYHRLLNEGTDTRYYQ